MDNREFREILDRCLEGSATSEEERRLIEAAEADSERRRLLLELSSFDAVLRSLSTEPENLVRRIMSSISHQGKTRSFARVMRVRLERERTGPRGSAGREPGIPPGVWGLAAAAAVVAFLFLLSMPREFARPILRGREAKTAAPVGATAPPVAGREASPSESPPPSTAPGSTERVRLPRTTVQVPEVPPTPLRVPGIRPPAVPTPRAVVDLPSPRSETKPSTLSAPATVAVLEGPPAVMAMVLSGTQELPASMGTALLPGQGLRTLEGSLPVQLQFPDGTRLEVGSDAELRDLAGEHASAGAQRGKRLRVLKGSVRAVVAKQPKGQPMVFETPHSSIKVVGTILRIDVDLDPKRGTRLEVQEGRVELQNLAGKGVEVPSGYAVWAAQGVDLVVRPIPALRKLAALCPIQDPMFLSQTGTGGSPLVPPWVSQGLAGSGVDHLNGRGGKNCAFIIQGNGVGGWSDISQTVTVAPNTVYTVSCFIQTNSTFPGHGAMGVRTTAGQVMVQQPYGKMADYTQLSVRFNSGSAGSVVIFAGFSLSPAQGTGWIHVDDWNMVP